jgi:hemolysin III
LSSQPVSAPGFPASALFHSVTVRLWGSPMTHTPTNAVSTSTARDSTVQWTFDAKRGDVAVKPLWRGWMHLIWFQVSLVLGTVLILRVEPSSRTATIVYSASVSGLFGASALYHRGNWRPRLHGLLQRLDHTMIFVFIAGSATPVFLIAMPGATGTALLAGIWTLAATASIIHLAWMDAPEALVGSTFVGLGLLGVLALPAVLVHSGFAAFALLLAGGVLYIVGAALYHRRRPDPRPAVFGFHEVFHAFVCAAAAAQYVAIAVFVL